jgi:hypothetical protein
VATGVTFFLDISCPLSCRIYQSVESRPMLVKRGTNPVILSIPYTLNPPRSAVHIFRSSSSSPRGRPRDSSLALAVSVSVA